MYSSKEKIHHFNQLANPNTAEVDLKLLRTKKPQEDFTRFILAPRKNAEDILFALLDVASHDEIVRNRRELMKEKDVKTPVPTVNGDNPPKITDDDSVVNGDGAETLTSSGKKSIGDGEGDKPPTPPENNPTTSDEGDKIPTHSVNESTDTGEGDKTSASPENNPTTSDGGDKTLAHSVNESTDTGEDYKATTPPKKTSPKKKKKSTQK